MLKELNNKAKTELREHIANGIEDLRGSNINVCDLHHELFNTDYYIIGTYQAEEKLKEWGLSSFQAIELVMEYEREQFGEVTTKEINAETICNMIAYIGGEELLYNTECYQTLNDYHLDDGECVPADLEHPTIEDALLEEFQD